MKTSVSFCEFVDAFRAYDRMDNFSYEGLKALFEYLEDYEEDTGEEIELDVIALCCDFSEYSSAKEAAEEYGFVSDIETPDVQNWSDVVDEEEQREYEALEWLQDRTQVIEFSGEKYDFDQTPAKLVPYSGIIIQAF